MKLYNIVRSWITFFLKNERPDWNYKILKNCPHPPQKFIDLASTGNCSLFGPQPPSAEYALGKNPRIGRKIVLPGKTDPELSVRTPRYLLGEEFDQWLRENVLTKFGETVVAISYPGNGGSFGPHTDRWRNYTLIYTVDPGGDDVRTTFWKEKFYPTIRDRGTFINKYSNLVEIDSVTMKSGQWVILESRVLHSVEKIKNVRINFQISIDRDTHELEKFI